MSRRVHAIVSGRVQGVSFRVATRLEARRLGVVGWVRNLADGTVELEAEGPDEAIATLLAWCKRGPTAARVTSVAADDIPLIGRESAFEIS